MVAPRRDEGLDSARRHADAGEFDEAPGELKRILVADPSDTEACVALEASVRRAECLRARGSWA